MIHSARQDLFFVNESIASEVPVKLFKPLVDLRLTPAFLCNKELLECLFPRAAAGSLAQLHWLRLIRRGNPGGSGSIRQWQVDIG